MSSYGNRPPTSTSSNTRTGTGMQSSSGSFIPRTARTKTGQLTTGGVGVALSTDMDVESRPITREGMHAVGTAKKGPERQVQDKTYWLSSLRTRIKELEGEIQTISTNTQKLQKDAAQEFSLSKKKKELQTEVQQLHDEFRDWNLAVEKLQEYGDDPTDRLDKELNELIQANNQKSEEADHILKRKIDKEEKIQQLNDKIQNLEDQFMERLSQHPRLQNNFHQLKDEEHEIDSQLQSREQDLSQVEQSYNQLYDQLKEEPDKIRYLDRLQEKKDLMAQRADLKHKIRDIENEGNAEKDQFKRIMAEVKEMQKEKEKISAAINTDLKAVKEKEKKLGEYTGPKAQKFKEYQQKEKQILEVVQNYPKQKKDLTQKLKKHQEMIVELSEHISTNLVDKDSVPSVSQLSSMQESLQRKREEYERSKSTFERLQQDLDERKKELEKMKTLDKKIEHDLKSTTENIQRMTRELKVYEDIDGMKISYEDLKQEMLKYKEEQILLRDAMQRQINNLSRTHTHMQKRLHNNATYENLSELQKKIRVYEQNNHSIRDYIMTKGSETDYSNLREDSLGLVNELNEINKRWASA